MKKYNLTRDQVTVLVLQKYQREKKIQSRRKILIERDKQIVENYKELRRTIS